uniref:Secreted protein n=1 Tax=Ixodes ricinus TaxID=34613 RepID=A0A6B0TUU0_IXORI
MRQGWWGTTARLTLRCWLSQQLSASASEEQRGARHWCSLSTRREFYFWHGTIRRNRVMAVIEQGALQISGCIAEHPV